MKQLTPRWIALVTITAITLYVAWLIFQPFIGVLLWSLVLTVIASPLHRIISRYNRSTNISALLTVFAVVVIVIIPIFFIVNAVVGHIDEAVDTLQHVMTRLSDPQSPHVRWLSQYVDLTKLVQAEDLRGQAKVAAKYLASYTADIVGWTAFAVMQFLLVLFTTFYMLRDGHKLLLAARDLLPVSKIQADSLFQSIQTIISASLRGTVLIAAIQGTLGGLAFWVLGLPTPALWGVIMFFMSLVPVVGSSLIWVPAAIYLATSGSYIKAILLVVWGVGVIAMIDNILRPVLVGAKTRMHELTVFFSVLGGLKLFGPVGIVVGPIVVALSVGLMRIFEESANEAPAATSLPASANNPPPSVPANPAAPDSPPPRSQPAATK